MRRARRSRSESTAKSPRAWAALTMPNVNFCPGTGISAASSQGGGKKTPGSGPPWRAGGGMEKARGESEASGGFFGVANLVTDGLQGFFVGVVHLDVAEKGEVVARADASEMRAQNSREIRVVLEDGGVFFVGKRVGALALR